MAETYEEYLKEQAVFHKSLGGVIDAFASAERELNGLLGKLAGLNHDMTNALLSGVKADQGCSLIRRVYRAKKAEVPKALDAALGQLKTISTDRNLIVHHGSISNLKRGRISSNYRVILPDTNMREISVSPAQLDRMATDLAGISLVFDSFKPGRSFSKSDAYDQTVADAVRCAQDGAWHYKSMTL